ncbi:amino acid adenylation domain-containing protein [Streptomyces sp. 130]|uniref:non-ribosomal peptide synthetase n=1 Tax=Streptomyces sp. 130 TaxID=2591006 RepID=UPI0011803732|nr:non-ribosomal peptide synthetase [Streptomyces sp. 130]TRV80761.1 amino acid adenylation domain-containing protein [Streptomyces sp. 130]
MSTQAVQSYLTRGQKRLWFLHQMDPDDASYNIPLVLRLSGELSEPALRAAFDAVAARHEALRSRFPAEDGEPAALVAAPGPVDLERCDLRGEGDRLATLIAERTNRPFDLARGPLLRVALFRTGDTEHVLCVVLHHIVADGWSLNVLRDELAAHYTAHLRGRTADLPAPPAHPAEQERDADEAGAHEALAYWRERLDGAPALELPLDRPRPEHPSPEGAFHTQLLTGAGPLIDALARARRCTPFMVLLAAYQATLHRCTGQRDFCVGVPTAGRSGPDAEQAIGYFSRTLVLRSDLSGTPTFADLLRRARTTVLGAFAHDRVPFEELAESLRLDRDPGRTPLFQTMLTVHTQDAGLLRDASFAGLGCTELDPGMRACKFDLTLDVRRDGEDVVAVFGYRTDLLDRDRVARLARWFETLLRGAMNGPDTPVHLLPLLDEPERTALEAAGRGPALPGGPSTVHDAIARTVRDRPGAQALRGRDASLSYAELWEGAGRLAGRLTAEGVGRGDVVGVLMPRGPHAVTAMLAAWRAGAAYLPLDPDYPPARIAYMAADSGARTVLTSRGTTPPGLPGGIRTLYVEDAAGTGPAGEMPAGPTVPLPDDPAYLVYTSGSTGEPKGVLVPHRALAERVRWMREGYGISAEDRVLHCASLSFDTCAEELFPALAAGATLVVADPGAPLPDQLTEDFTADVTVMDLPTPYWQHLVGEPDAVAWPDRLRLLILGADQVQAAAVGAWRERFGDRVRLVNSYGPTETTVIATTADLGAADTRARPPIGTPIGGVTATVCDEHGGPVPPGTPGELLLGGTGVTHGYTGRPGATARAFVPDPYGPPGSRRYRTGDLVRRRADGALEFLGRLDGQLKVRGYRVEPGETENALLAQRGVAEAAVVAHRDTLVAYVVPAAAEPVDPVALRSAVGALLPAHLVPAAVLVLDRLPLTPNGKLDRAALPAPEQRPELRASYLAPRTEAEELVADIWREVLDIERVGALDDFFDLGGHSLLATRVIARVRATAELTVPLRTLFTHRTVAAFAEAVEAALTAEIDALSEEEAAALLASDGGTLEGTGTPS